MANRTKRTPKKDEKFLAHLAATADVTASAKAVGYSRRSVYEWRDKDETWRDKWEEAWQRGVDALEEEALRRGVEGVLEPVWHKGEIVGHRRKYSDNLLMFMLKGRRPETFRDNASVEHSGQAGAPLDFTVNLVRPCGCHLASMRYDYEFARTLTHERRTAYDHLSEILREGRMDEGLRTDYKSYVMALRCIEKARIAFDDAMLCFDFIITPSAPGGAPFGLHETGSPRFNMAWTCLHAPVITLPMTTDQRGLPLGLQMTGRRHEDEYLLNFAEAVFRKFLV